MFVLFDLTQLRAKPHLSKNTQQNARRIIPKSSFSNRHLSRFRSRSLSRCDIMLTQKSVDNFFFRPRFVAAYAICLNIRGIMIFVLVDRRLWHMSCINLAPRTRSLTGIPYRLHLRLLSPILASQTHTLLRLTHIIVCESVICLFISKNSKTLFIACVGNVDCASVFEKQKTCLIMSRVMKRLSEIKVGDAIRF